LPLYNMSGRCIMNRFEYYFQLSQDWGNKFLALFFLTLPPLVQYAIIGVLVGMAVVLVFRMSQMASRIGFKNYAILLSSVILVGGVLGSAETMAIGYVQVFLDGLFNPMLVWQTTLIGFGIGVALGANATYSKHALVLLID